jgi:AAA domain-containing protein
MWMADEIGTDPDKLWDRFVHHFQPPSPNGHTNGAGKDKLAGAYDLYDFLARPIPDRQPVVADLLDRDERVIVTGGEGDGKSTYIRQTCMQAAAGIHPLTLERVEPMKALYVDLENPDRHLNKSLKGLTGCLEDQLPRGQFTVAHRPEGLMLDRGGEDREYIANMAKYHRPDFIGIGPLYKMTPRDLVDEEVSKEIQRFLDQIRTGLHCALMIEAHQPQAPKNGGGRPRRPYGASAWLRWPEFGIHLGGLGELSHWRGARDPERPWPKILQRGGAWPWTVADPDTMVFDPSEARARDDFDGLAWANENLEDGEVVPTRDELMKDWELSRARAQKVRTAVKTAGQIRAGQGKVWYFIATESR